MIMDMMTLVFFLGLVFGAIFGRCFGPADRD